MMSAAGANFIFLWIIMITFFVIYINGSINKNYKYILIAVSTIFILYFTLFPYPGKEYPDEDYIAMRMYGGWTREEATKTTADMFLGKFDSISSLFKSFNFIPFNNFKSCGWSFSVFFRQIIGNVVLFMPLGFSLAFFKDKISVKKALLCIFLSTLSIEIIQVCVDIITGYRVKIFDVDDLITNFVGGAIGLFIGIFAINYFNTYIKKKLDNEECIDTNI